VDPLSRWAGQIEIAKSMNFEVPDAVPPTQARPSVPGPWRDHVFVALRSYFRPQGVIVTPELKRSVRVRTEFERDRDGTAAPASCHRLERSRLRQ
jgi:hypothetical protein